MDNTTVDEKAKELIEKFWQYSGDYKTPDAKMKRNAKQCALICQKEKIDMLIDLSQVYTSMGLFVEHEKQIFTAIEKH